MTTNFQQKIGECGMEECSGPKHHCHRSDEFNNAPPPSSFHRKTGFLEMATRPPKNIRPHGVSGKRRRISSPEEENPAKRKRLSTILEDELELKDPTEGEKKVPKEDKDTLPPKPEEELKEACTSNISRAPPMFLRVVRYLELACQPNKNTRPDRVNKTKRISSPEEESPTKRQRLSTILEDELELKGPTEGEKKVPKEVKDTLPPKPEQKLMEAPTSCQSACQPNKNTGPDKINKRKRTSSHEKTAKKQRLSTILEDELELKGPSKGKKRVSKKVKHALPPKPEQTVKYVIDKPPKEMFRGLPNIGQTCYMNSSLQSLLSLRSFMADLICGYNVWNSDHEASVIRYLAFLKMEHNSWDSGMKRYLLSKFKTAVSAEAPEFMNDSQKDTHEFLSTVLAQIRSCAPQLQFLAENMGQTYKCPVEAHMVFKLETTRTCKICGKESSREEEFTNLSLDLIPGGGTVEEMLQNYLKETDLEYRCDCGATVSSQRLSFATLPENLILHLKRITYMPPGLLEKVQDPVELLKELIIPCKTGSERYALFNVISHLGPSAISGHYVCDAVHPYLFKEKHKDSWLTFDDTEVTKTRRASVFEARQNDAYVLIYTKTKCGPSRR